MIDVDVRELLAHPGSSREHRLEQPVDGIRLELVGMPEGAAVRGDRGEEGVGELAPERGADLGDLLDRGEAVEAGEQRVVQGRWQRERRQRPGQLVMIARVPKQTRFEHRLGQLLDEQRHAVGLGHDLRRDLVRQRLVPNHPFDQGGALAPAEPGQ